MTVPLWVPLAAAAPTDQATATEPPVVVRAAPPAWDRPIREGAELPRAWTPTPPPATAWALLPVATALHPVRVDYAGRYHQLVARSMGGRGASSVFGPTVAEADLHWRFVVATGEGLSLDEGAPTRWSTMAASGALMAVESLTDETLERAPTLHVAWVAADAVVNPSLRLRETRRGVDVDHPTGKVRRDYERAAEALDDLPADDRPRPTLHLGLDWSPREEDAPPEAPPIDWRAWLTTNDTLISSMRMEMSLRDYSWSVSGRERVAPRLFLVGGLRGDTPETEGPRVPPPDGPPTPSRWSAGLMWALPRSEGWTLRLERIVALAEPQETWMLTLRGENHTVVPVRPGRAGATTTPFPAVPERGPNVVGGW